MIAESVELLPHITRRHLDYRGFWRTIVFRPDLRSPQEFVVGVLTHWRGEMQAVRLLTSFSKLQCVYGERFVDEQIGFAFSRIRTTLQAACNQHTAIPDVASISPNWKLGADLYCAGESPEQALDQIYPYVVALEPDAESSSSRRFESRSVDSIRAELHRLLKPKLLSRFETIIEERGHIDRKINDKTLQFHVDVKTQSKIAAFCSAWYASASTVEHNIFIPYRDIQYLGSMDNIEKCALFIARPLNDPRIDRIQAERIDKVMDQTCDMLKSAGWEVEVDEDLERLSDEIINFVEA